MVQTLHILLTIKTTLCFLCLWMNIVTAECIIFIRIFIHVCTEQYMNTGYIINRLNTAHLIDNQDDSMLLMSTINIVSAECALFMRVYVNVYILYTLLIG